MLLPETPLPNRLVFMNATIVTPSLFLTNVGGYLRSVKRPKFTLGDCKRLTLLARSTNLWQSTMHIIQPDTILRWHRDMFRRYWKRISTPKSREPCIPRETISLIKALTSTFLRSLTRLPRYLTMSSKAKSSPLQYPTVCFTVTTTPISCSK